MSPKAGFLNMFRMLKKSTIINLFRGLKTENK